MSEYIMGLGISVKICKLYEKLAVLSFFNQSDDEKYFRCVNEIKKLMDEETLTYDKLDVFDLNKYFMEINKENINEFDPVKNRYYLRLKERIELLNSNIPHKYPFTLNTAILGKILLEALSKIENQFLTVQRYNEYNIPIDDSINNLYYFHKTYKYTLITSNEFLERLAIDFNFELCKIPNVTFDKIKEDFEHDNSFYKKLNNSLYLIAIDTINELISKKNIRQVQDIYSNLLSISQLEVITSYLDKESLEKISQYYKSTDMKECPNGKYIVSALSKKRNR